MTTLDGTRPEFTIIEPALNCTMTAPKRNRDQTAGVDFERLISALKSCLPKKYESVKLHEPLFGGNEWKYLKDCLDSTVVSSIGQYVDRLEADLAKYTGMKKAVAVMNGTAALHIALTLAGTKAGDEILVPTLTFVATANAVSYTGGIPHFVDSNETTLGVDPTKLESELRRTAVLRNGRCYNKRSGRCMAGLIVAHILGHPAHLDAIHDICRRFRLFLIEDAAEAIGSLYKGKHVGHWGKLSVLSFNGNKTITTGGGGAILTNDEKLARAAKHLTTTARVPHPWRFAHDMIGYNYRLPNLNAALGCAQLEQLPAFLMQKRNLAMRYENALSGLVGLRFLKEPPFAQSNYWLNAILLDERRAADRDRILQLTNDSGISTRPLWTLMHRLPMYGQSPRAELATAESLEKRVVNLPSSPFL